MTDYMENPEPLFGVPISRWEKRYAWLPIKVWDQRWVWLKSIQRQRIMKKSYMDTGPDFWWQYKL